MGGNNCVGMICGSYHHGVNVIAHVIEHDPPVPEFLCVRVALKFLFGITPVHITKRYNIFSVSNLPDDAGSPSSNSYARDVQFVTRWRVAETAYNRAGKKCKSCSGCTGFTQKIFA